MSCLEFLSLQHEWKEQICDKDKGMGGSKKGDGLHAECFDECPVNIRAEVHLITQRGRPDNAAATLFGFFAHMNYGGFG